MAGQHVGPPSRSTRKIVLREQGWIPGPQDPGSLFPRQGHPQMYATRPLPAVPPNSIPPAPRPSSTASSVYADEPSRGPTTVEFIARAPPTGEGDSSDFCGALDEDALALVRPISLLTRLTHEQDSQEDDVASPQPRLRDPRQLLFINTNEEAISPILPSPSSGTSSRHPSYIVSPLTPHTYIDMYRDTPTSTNGDSVAMNEGRWPAKAVKPGAATPPPQRSSWDHWAPSPSLSPLGFQPAAAFGPDAESQRRKAAFRHSDPISPVLLKPLTYRAPASEMRPRTSGKDTCSRSSQDARYLRDTPLRSPYYEEPPAGALESPNTRWDKAYGPLAASPIDSGISMAASSPGKTPSKVTTCPFPVIEGTSPAAAPISTPSRPRKDSKVSFAVSPPSGFSTRPRGSSRGTPPPHLVLKSGSGSSATYVKSPFPLPATGDSWEDNEGEGQGARPGTAEDDSDKKSPKRLSPGGRSGAPAKPQRTDSGGPRVGLEKLVSRMAQPFVSEETKRERRIEQLKRGIQHPVHSGDANGPRDGSWI